MKKYRILIMIPLIILLSSWGRQGHQKISSSIIDCFIEEMALFEDWVPFLTEHASDADSRKSADPSEGPKHYIDIDAYPEFLENGSISTYLDSCVSLHGAGFVADNGYLPWATLNTYNKIVEYMREEDWVNAKIAAADLGHYVADGFMPLHITKNYNGQETGNDGIHSRYESTMIGDHIDEIIYDGSPAQEIDDVRAYIFSYLYANYVYNEDILNADDNAKSVSGGAYNSSYYDKLWEETGDLTIDLFSGASHALTSLLYTAWLEAGGTEVEQTDLIISTEEAYLPDFIGVTYRDVGMIYVVPENTAKDLAMIRAASLDSLNALANFEVKIPLSELPDGNYWLYARDYYEKLIGPVEISVTHVGIQAFTGESLLVYPNPLERSTCIEFELSQKEDVFICILDASGRRVQVIVDGALPAGSHKVMWNAEGVSAGSYLILLEMEEKILTSKLLKL